MSTESPVVGPNTAKVLGDFASMPEPEYATEADIEAMIGMLSLGKPKRQMSKEEAEANLGQYVQILAGSRKADLEAAYDEMLRSKTFMPTVSEVYESVKGFEARRRYRKSRARHLVAIHRREWSPPVEMATAEDVAGIKELMDRRSGMGSGS